MKIVGSYLIYFLGITKKMRMDKEKEKKLAKIEKKERKKAEIQAVITKQRKKIHKDYVFAEVSFEKSSTMVKDNDAQTKPPLDEINKITDVLETLINKHKMTDMGNENLLKTDEVKEDIIREVNSYADIFAAAKNFVEKVEIAHNFLLHIKRAGNTLNEDTENKNSGDFIIENSSDDVSGTIDTDEVEKNSEEKIKNSKDDIAKNTMDDTEMENYAEESLENSQNMGNSDQFHKNPTKNTEDHMWDSRSPSPVFLSKSQLLAQTQNTHMRDSRSPSPVLLSQSQLLAQTQNTTDEVKESLGNPQNMEFSDQFHKNPAERNEENTLIQVTDEVKESGENSPNMQSVEKNKTQSTSKNISSNQHPNDLEKKLKRPKYDFSDNSKSFNGISQVSETPEKENIKPVENLEIVGGQVSELENFKETKTVTSSVAENQQYLKKNFKCSVLFSKSNSQQDMACLFETRQIALIKQHLIEKHKLDETLSNWTKFFDFVKNDDYNRRFSKPVQK